MGLSGILCVLCVYTSIWFWWSAVWPLTSMTSRVIMSVSALALPQAATPTHNIIIEWPKAIFSLGEERDERREKWKGVSDEEECLRPDANICHTYVQRAKCKRPDTTRTYTHTSEWVVSLPDSPALFYSRGRWIQTCHFLSATSSLSPSISGSPSPSMRYQLLTKTKISLSCMFIQSAPHCIG